MASNAEITIDISTLRSNFQSNVATDAGVSSFSNVRSLDYMFQYLDEYKKMCQRRRDAYNLHSTKLRHRHNLVSIPLLALTSTTSVIAALQMDKIVVTSLGAASAVFTAIQRFCSYAERAENSRMVAKGFSKITRKIEDTLMYIKSSAASVDVTVFTKLIEDIQRDFEATNQQAHEVPWELLQYINTVDSNMWCFYSVVGTKGRKEDETKQMFG